MGYIYKISLLGYNIDIYLVGGKDMENYVQTPAQLGQVLKARRSNLRLTQKKAGGTVGLLPKTISALEISPEGSSISSLFKLLSALDLEIVLRPKDFIPEKIKKLEW